MEITGKKIDDMIANKSISSRYANWIHTILSRDAQLKGDRVYKDTGIKIHREYNILSNTYDLSVDTRSKRIIRIKNCFSFWFWDIYYENEVMDLKQVQRCKDKFCPNCRAVNLSKSLMDFYPVFTDLLLKGFRPYLLTLTVPNVFGSDLKQTIVNINNAWSKYFYVGLSRDFDKGGYRDRFFTIEGAIKVVEITKNDNTNTFHPHLHVLMFTDGSEVSHAFYKDKQGEYSNKRNEYNMLSVADSYIREKWTKAYSKITKKDFDNNLMCDIRFLDSDDGLYEVFKYTFKDSDITNYSDFCYVFESLHRKRARQGYGMLYNLKLEDNNDDIIVDDIKNYLKKNSSEQGELLTTKINDINKEYNNYTKISRFNSTEVFEKILEKNT